MAKSKKTVEETDVQTDSDDITFIGDVLKVKRLVTGMWSLDRAFRGYGGELGFPVTSMEIFGPTNSGKSSLSYSMAGLVCADMKKQLALADLEGFNPDTFRDILRGAKYRGPVRVINGETSDEILDNLLEAFDRDDVGAIILDSVAAISPLAELNSSSGEANMGRRAKTVSAYYRKLINKLRQNPKLAIHTNHVLPNLGWVGNTTPGGQALHYLSAVRIAIKSKKLFPDGSFVIEGVVKKNRWGFRDLSFTCFFLMGHGLHVGMSSVWDCYEQKILVQKKGDKSLRWKDSGESISTFSTFAKLAKSGEEEAFQPFIDALSGLTPDDVTIQEDKEEEES